jgi:hypothetical protein
MGTPENDAADAEMEFGEGQRGTLFPKLVLCISRSAAYHSEDGEYDSDSPVTERVHSYLVSNFSKHFDSLVLELELLGFEVFSEFYVDKLWDEDYELSVSHTELDEVSSLVAAFHEAADEILNALPDHV